MVLVSLTDPFPLHRSSLKTSLWLCSFRDGVSADSFNRFKLGRSLDKAFSYGCDMLFSEIALSVCRQEGIDLRFQLP